MDYAVQPACLARDGVRDRAMPRASPRCLRHSGLEQVALAMSWGRASGRCCAPRTGFRQSARSRSDGAGSSGAVVLTLVALGGLWLFVWRGVWRLAGLVLVAELPPLLILWSRPAGPAGHPDCARCSKLIGIMGTKTAGCWIMPTAQGFAAKSWLRRDGDAAAQDGSGSSARDWRAGNGTNSAPWLSGWSGPHVVWSKKSRRNVEAGRAVQPDRLNPDRQAWRGDRAENASTFGKQELARSGAVAISISRRTVRTIRRARDPSQVCACGRVSRCGSARPCGPGSSPDPSGRAACHTPGWPLPVRSHRLSGAGASGSLRCRRSVPR